MCYNSNDNMNNNLTQYSLGNRIELIPRKLLKDNRGWFLKVLTGKEKGLPQYTGEIYITSAMPQQSKGGHYHEIANEWFTILTGRANLKLKDVKTGEKMNIILDSTNPVTVVVPPYVAHCFDNESDRDFILLAYTDLLYDPKDTITYTI